MTVPKRLPAALLATFACLLALPAAASAAGDTVHVRGTVYTFGTPDPIEGATVRVAELPGRVATTGPDGAYDLEVPDGTRITPYVEAAGHHGIHLQTIVTQGRDLERFNFQIPTDAVYVFLAALLEVPLDENGDPQQCVIVSTFSTEAVRDLSFEEFRAFGPHGVAGATASATPALPGPIYFNSSVLPDPSLTESSDDGGVIWLGVPPGVYRLSAQHPTERFAELIATCVDGRLVNANPPQGLYQLRAGEQVDSAVAASLRSARFRRAGGERVLRVKTRSGEYVAVAAELVRGGKRIAAAGGDEGARAFEEGRRRLRLALRGGVDPGSAKLRVTFADGAGNEKLVREKLRVPAA